MIGLTDKRSDMKVLVTCEENMMDIKQELIEILTYFNDGLKDVEAGSGEEQPMQKRIEAALRRVKILINPDNPVSLERAKKYARHQYFLGTQGANFVEFEDWANKG
jgi:hypothetical protein